MPIYEYTCSTCAHDFEARLERAGDSAPACPACGATKVEKRFSAFAVGVSTGKGPDLSGLPPCQGGTAPGCGMGACGLS